VELVPGVSLFGVFDGHGGPEVSRFISNHLANILLNNLSFKSGNYKEALEEAFLELDMIL
jgi:serine/threonine protein phosphatase PrpC